VDVEGWLSDILLSVLGQPVSRDQPLMEVRRWPVLRMRPPARPPALFSLSHSTPLLTRRPPLL
jgi:hypothetical protein